MIRLYSIAAFILLTSCTMPRPHFVARQPVAEGARAIVRYKTDVPETKAVGESMIERVYQQIYPGFVAKEDFNVPKGLDINTSASSISKGAMWMCTQYISTDDYACSSIPSSRSIVPGKRYYGLAINKSGEVIGIIEETFGDLVKFDSVIGGKLLPIDVPTGESYRQELIYSGLSKDTIMLSCREYKNDTADPVFVQDLAYDLASSREIAFKDLRIEILYATESDIKFYVKK